LEALEEQQRPPPPKEPRILLRSSLTSTAAAATVSLPPYLGFYSKSQQQAHLQSSNEGREYTEVMDWILGKLKQAKKVARPKRLVSHEKRAKALHFLDSVSCSPVSRFTDPTYRFTKISFH